MKRGWEVLSFLPFLFWVSVRVYNGITFDIDCTERLKRAADANTIELAKSELQHVVQSLERRGLTTGYTSVLFQTPNEDVGFWYTNLKASLGVLESVRPDAPLLEQSNLLIKLRETLLDEGQQPKVTEPRGVSIYPHNVLYAVWGWLSVMLLAPGVLSIAKTIRDHRSRPRKM
jgi:hypothetical protein